MTRPTVKTMSSVVRTILVATLIAASPYTVFALIIDLPAYNEWLPHSTAYKGTTEVSDTLIVVGSKYIERSPSGTRYGEVCQLDHAQGHVVFRQPMRLALGLEVQIQVDMKVNEARGKRAAGVEAVTSVVDRTVTLDFPWYMLLVAGLVTAQFKEEIDRTMTEMRRYLERHTENASMPLNDKLKLWESKADISTSSWRDQDDWDKDQWAIEEEDEFPDVQEYSHLLLRSPAYKWLQTSLDSLLKVMIPGATDARKSIQNLLLTSFPRVSRLSRKNGPALQNVTFTSPWILAFLESQEYRIPLHEVLPKILLLVGTPTSAWATTCEHNIKTIWPGFGLQILGTFTHLLKSPLEPQRTYLQSDQIRITFDISSDCQTLTAQITGMTHSIIEVIEILTWFDSLRYHQSGVSRVVASCTVNQSEAQDICIAPKSKVQLEPLEKNPVKKEGQCWLSLFDEPMLLTGFPILSREEELSGIEMSLGMLLLLAGSRKVSKFRGKMFIKGFSAALVPTKRAGDHVMWHVVVSPSGGHLSFADPQIQSCLGSYPEDLAVSDLQSARHIVGWSNLVKNNTGSSFADYNIEWSGLNRPKAGFAFDKISIVGGMFVTGGISCILGKKDKAVHVRARDDYTMRLKWISKKFVVLYDVADKRAWLVDGASALLHLVRASLKRDSTDLFSSHFLYKKSSLVEAPADFNGKQASVFVLTHQSNLSLPLYAKPAATRHETNMGHSGAHSSVTTHTKTDYCLKDRTESIYEVLEQIIAHQADVASEDGVGFRVKTTIRRQLEGFDFMDIATDEDPLWPRTTSLQPQGRGWVDFTRAIHAITLFGTGFGELIQPTLATDDTSCRKCSFNVSVPRMSDYLTVCISDMREILQKQGSHTTNSWRLVDDIYWHMPEPPFDPCLCSSTSKASALSTRRVQVLLPSTLPRFLRGGLCSPSDLSLAHPGAVLFGYSSRFPLRWGDLGAPEIGPLADGIENLDVSLTDDMLGTSMGSSSTPGEHSTGTSLSIGTGGTEVSSISDDGNGEPARKRSRTLIDWLKK
ncbi:hypothetical protein CC79DRAFT_1393692 [Sarocladium strictum]